VEEMVMEIDTSMSSITDNVDDMDKRFEEFKSERDTKELYG